MKKTNGILKTINNMRIVEIIIIFVYFGLILLKNSVVITKTIIKIKIKIRIIKKRIKKVNKLKEYIIFI